MATKTYQTVSKRTKASKIPQSQPLDETQVQNNAGGFAYGLDPWKQFERFLVLGTEGGTYYVGEQKLTKDAAKAVEACIAEDGKRAVDLIVAISEAGRAPKNDPALFALALASGDANVETRKYALANLSRVARIPTHLYHFVTFAEQFRGWGRSLRNAIEGWVNGFEAEKLAYEFVKYQSRDGWSSRDVLRKAHVRATDQTRDSVLRWAVGGLDSLGERTVTRKSAGVPVQYVSPRELLPAIIPAFEALKGEKDAGKVIKAIQEFGLTREMIPTEHLKSVKVWEALLEKMPMEAMIRSLAQMTKVGLLTPTGEATKTVVARLGNTERLRKSRIHPLKVLNALLTYQRGYGLRAKFGAGSAEGWTAVSKIVDALDGAFYQSFGNVEPTGKRLVLALDVSGSMGGPEIAGTAITPRMGTAALALVTASVEKDYAIIGFTSSGSRTFGSKGGRWGYGEDAVSLLNISPRQRLDDVVKSISGLPFGGTDCALPMLWAMTQKEQYDAFVVYTDSETWAGTIHPTQAVRDYRKGYVADAKMVVVGMVATQFSIADPKDPGMLDVVGFDLNTPQLVSDFVKG